MKFNDWSRMKLRLGVKRLTSRKKSHEADRDVAYVVGPLPWKFIREFLCREEGADSPEELQEVIDTIFTRRGYPVADNEEFYVHILKDCFLTAMREKKEFETELLKRLNE